MVMEMTIDQSRLKNNVKNYYNKYRFEMMII